MTQQLPDVNHYELNYKSTAITTVFLSIHLEKIDAITVCLT